MKRANLMAIILTMVMIAGFSAIAGAYDQPGDSPMSAPMVMQMEGPKAMSMEGPKGMAVEAPKGMERMIAESQIRPLEILVRVSGKSPEQVKMLVMHKGLWAAAQQLKAADALVMAMIQKRFQMIDFLVARNKIGLKQALLVKMALLRRVMTMLPDKQMGMGMMGAEGSGMMGKGMMAGDGKMGGMDMPCTCENCKGQAQVTEATAAPEGDKPEAAKPEAAKPETAAPVTAPEHQH